MSVLRYIAILSFMALITGCSDVECLGPGYPSFPDCPTNFMLKVVAIDSNSGQVEVVYPQDVPDDRLPGVIKTSVEERRKSYKNYEPFKIYVRELKQLVDAHRLEVGKIYVFHNGNGSPFFEVFPEKHELFPLKDRQ